MWVLISNSIIVVFTLIGIYIILVLACTIRILVQYTLIVNYIKSFILKTGICSHIHITHVI